MSVDYKEFKKQKTYEGLVRILEEESQDMLGRLPLEAINSSEGDSKMYLVLAAQINILTTILNRIK